MRLGFNNVFPLPLTEPKPFGPPDTFASNAPGDLGYREPITLILLETSHESGMYASAYRIAWTGILLGADGVETTASLETHLAVDDLDGAASIGDRHLTHLLEQLSPDRRVLIVQPRGASAAKILFAGYPMPQTINWSARGESVSAQCVDAGLERLRTGFYQQIRGRLMRFAPNLAWSATDPDGANVEALPTIFNAGGRPNRSAAAYPYTIGGNTYRVHLFVDDDEAGAKFWRYTDALRYVLLNYVVRATGGAPVDADAFLHDTSDWVDDDELADDKDPFARLLGARCEDLACRSVSVAEALALICDTARLHWAIDTTNTGTAEAPIPGHNLRIWASLDDEAAVAATSDREMGSPEIDDLPREVPWTDMTDRTAREIAEAGAIVQARLSIDNRRVQPIHYGGPKLFEVTLLLRPWWEPHDQLDNLTTAALQADAMTYWTGGRDVVGQFWADINPATGDVLSIYNAKHPDHGPVKDVGRLWAFPDVADVNADSLARANWPAELYSPYDPTDAQSLVYAHPTIGGGIPSDEDGQGPKHWVPRRRPFLQTIGRRNQATDRAPVLWINYNASEPHTALLFDPDGWIPLSHGFQVDARRGAVSITADNLLLDANLRDTPESDGMIAENQYLRAYIEGRLQLAITCCIAGDQRVYHEADPPTGGAERTRYQLHDNGDEEFPSGDRTHNRWASQFEDVDPDYAETATSSLERFEEFADEDAKHKQKPVVAGPVECFWLEDRWRTGDGFSGCKGLGLEFETYPAIQRVQLSNGPGGHRTLLHLTDLRERPEVEAETVA